MYQSVNYDAAFSALPSHKKVFVAACSAYRSLPDVSSLCLGGSFGTGRADAFSDIDLAIIVRAGRLVNVWDQRKTIEGEIGPVLFRLDLKEISEYSSAAYYKNYVKLHMTYIAIERLAECLDFSSATIVCAEDQRLVERWLEGNGERAQSEICESVVEADLRFWFWTLQGIEKLRRGELWASFDTLQMLRSIVVSCVDWARGLPTTGFRRLELRWDVSGLAWLEETITKPVADELARAYAELTSAYWFIRRLLTERYGVGWQVSPQALSLLLDRVSQLIGVTIPTRDNVAVLACMVQAVP